MYRTHFGLKALPFENVPDPAFFFDEGDYHRVLTRMSDAVAAGRGLLAVAGPIGAGKTTVSQRLMADLPEGAALIWLAEPPATDLELLRFIAHELGIETSPDDSRVFLLRDIRRELLGLLGDGKRALMVIDESHLANDDVLECIRLLNNLEEGPAKLLQIILLGQPELMTRLARPEMENFRQRIAGLEQIGTMDGGRLREYILHRLQVAGAEGEIFTDQALEAVCLSTGGVPRRTNSLCDRALRMAFEAGNEQVDTKDVHRAAMDLGMGRETMHYIVRMRSEETAVEQKPAEESGSDTVAEEAASPPEERETIPPSVRDGSPAQEAPRGLALPLALFTLSLLSLAGSVAFYCSRAPAATPAACLRCLLERFF